MAFANALVEIAGWKKVSWFHQRVLCRPNSSSIIKKLPAYDAALLTKIVLSFAIFLPFPMIEWLLPSVP